MADSTVHLAQESGSWIFKALVCELFKATCTFTYILDLTVVGVPFTVLTSIVCPVPYIARSVGLDVSILVRYLASFFSDSPAFSCPPGCLLLPSKVPCRMMFAMVLCQVTNQESLHHFTVANKGSCFPARESTCYLTYSFILCSG